MLHTIESKKCIVAFLDILGFKNYVYVENQESIKNFFKEIKRIRKNIKNDIFISFENDSRIDKYNNLSKNVFFRIMSDSIIIATDVIESDNFYYLVKWIKEIQCTLLQNNKILRGGISIDDFYADEEIMFGKGMIKSYELENKQAKYPRVVIDNEVMELFSKNTEFCSDLLFDNLSYPIVKKDNDDLYYIDYISDIVCGGMSIKVRDFLDKQAKGKYGEKYIWISEKIKESKIFLQDLYLQGESMDIMDN